MSEAQDVDLTIRAAEFADASVLATLMCELGYETRTAEMEMRLQSILKNTRYTTLVAVVEGKICGMIGSFCYDGYERNDLLGRILALVVATSMRRRGIAAALVRAAENDFARRNIRRVTLNTQLERKDALEFYERIGYVRNGFRFVKELAATTD